VLRLIYDYAAQPTFKRAQKISAYERSHPMCTVLLSPEQKVIVASAIDHANTPGSGDFA
jgi:hypothetical protein